MQHNEPYSSSGDNNGSGSNSTSNLGAAASDPGHVSPLSRLGFLGKLTAEKKQTKDGQPPKRRGPKPDSKPALTRRQELNRQAQRTHRERKELYIKALEQEVLRLKEAFSTTNRERDQVVEENRRLKELLAANGISYDFGASPIRFKRENSDRGHFGYGPSSSGSMSGSYTGTSDYATYSPPLYGSAHSYPLPSTSPPQHQQDSRRPSQAADNHLDYDQIGIDFVLTLERPCMDHIQHLIVQAHHPDEQPMDHPMEDLEHKHADCRQEVISGHAMMATAPPHSHIMANPHDKYPHQLPPELSTDTLAKLLDLSNRLPFDRQTEITPVMAWTQLFRHERLSEFTAQDIERVKNELSQKVRCYGFGAVLEDWEVRDAINGVLSLKDAPAALAGPPFPASHPPQAMAPASVPSTQMMTSSQIPQAC